MKKTLPVIGIAIGIALLLKALGEAMQRALSGGAVSSAPRILVMIFAGLAIGLGSSLAYYYFKAKPKDDYNELETLAKALDDKHHDKRP